MLENLDSEWFICFVDFCCDLLVYLLKIVSGKIEIFLQCIVDYGYLDCFGYLMWLELDEWQGNVELEQLQVFFVYLVYCLYSQLNYSFLCELYVVVNCEFVIIYFDDVQECGI